MSQYDDKLRPIDLKDVKTYPLASRPSKVSLDDFAKPVTQDSSTREWLSSLPNVLAGTNMRLLAGRVRNAREIGKTTICGNVVHVIKPGLAPIQIELAQKGFVSAIAA